jgi:hypothetical protein
MDADRMFPRGFHPVKDLLLHDILTPAPVIPRRDVGVRYYFVDYGISSYFATGSEPRLVLGRDGRDQDVPELSDEVPYDPFKVDIFTIGNVLRLELCNVSFCPSVSKSLSHIFLELYQLGFPQTPGRIYVSARPG